MTSAFVKLVFFTPATHGDVVRKAIGDAGAGQLGSYTHASWSSAGLGRCVPLAGAQSEYGVSGEIQVVEEERIETFCEKDKVKDVIAAVSRVHPYKEPTYEIIPLLSLEDL